MNNLDKRIEALADLGEHLQSGGNEVEEVIQKACRQNPWFTLQTVRESIHAVANNYLDKGRLERWLFGYQINTTKPRTIGLILAGNIPMVGFHDLLTVFICGHNGLVKLSEKDKVLILYMVDYLKTLHPEISKRITFAERLKNYDAIIATGSNTSAVQFERYFSHVPHIIRKNRNGVGVVFKDTTDESLERLGEDILLHFGLGCRNVAKLYLEKGFNTDKLFESLESQKDVRNHNKYMNNYDYNNALMLLNQEKFITNDFIILKESPSFNSRIATVHFEYFDSVQELRKNIETNRDQIQCVVTDRAIEGLSVIPFGKAQRPELSDYADGVDTVKFLTSL